MSDSTVDGGTASSTYTQALDGGNATTLFPAGGPLLTAYTDAAPCPRVTVNVTEVEPGTVTATLHRVYEDRNEIVPGADVVPATGGFVRTDYYPPLGVPVSYRTEMFDVNGASLGFTDSSTTTLDVPDSTCWISSPFTPSKSVQVELDDEASSALDVEVVATTHNIGGRRIVITEASYGYTNIPMSFWTQTLADAQAVEDVFLDGLGLTVIRVAPPMQVPRVLYAFGMPSRQEVNLPGGVEDAFFALAVDESTAPSTAVVAAVLTYGRFTNNLSSYGEFKQTYGSYRDAILNPPAEL